MTTMMTIMTTALTNMVVTDAWMIEPSITPMNHPTTATTTRRRHPHNFFREQATTTTTTASSPSSITSTTSSTRLFMVSSVPSSSSSSSRDSGSDFVDVEFERVVKDQDERKDSGDAHDDTPIDATGFDVSGSRKGKNLIDLSFETAATAAARADSDKDDDVLDWQNIPIPFCRGDEYIDCKLAFTVDYEGQTYGIGIPFETAVAIVVEEPVEDDTENKKIKNKKSRGNNIQRKSRTITQLTNVDPDMYDKNDEYAELMELFAKQIQEQFGEEFMLHKTPKVLTISGGLDEKVTKNWKQDLLPKPYPVETLLDAASGFFNDVGNTKNKETADSSATVAESTSAVDPELQEFYDFMRKELGDDEFESTMNQSEFTQEEMDLLQYFDIPPGFGGDGKEGEDELLVESIMADLKEIESMDGTNDRDGEDSPVGVMKEAQQFVKNTDNTALKLLSYEFPKSGKKYSLVQFLQPYTLVGRLCPLLQPSSSEGNDGSIETEEPRIEFDLLTPEEEKVLIPILEKLCQKDLEENGLKFQVRGGGSSSSSSSSPPSSAAATP
jgi:hypothetical protein